MRSYTLPLSRNGNYQGIFHGIRALLGDHAADKLVEKYGGGNPVYIPANIKEGHPLAELLGFEIAQILVDEFSGLTVEIPRNVAFLREERNSLIKSDYLSGMSQGKLAIKYQLTARHIRDIVNRCA